MTPAPAASPEDQDLSTEVPPSHADNSEIANETPGPDSEGDISVDSAGLKGWWKVFASTYVTIFLAEIGDKTQVTTLLMSAESHKPWLVFAGAGTALICTSLLGVLLGRWLATRLKPRTLEVSAGITLLIITIGLGWDIFQGL